MEFISIDHIIYMEFIGPDHINEFYMYRSHFKNPDHIMGI